MEANVPLIITGPPGCSKTLSFALAVENMKGSAVTEKRSAMFKKLKNIHRFHYQCSEYSTAKEIEAVFRYAMENQDKFEAAHMTSEFCVVFLDEAGLPPSEKHALKVIHHYLDHPKVGCVLLSNHMLDAAKVSRLDFCIF